MPCNSKAAYSAGPLFKIPRILGNARFSGSSIRPRFALVLKLLLLFLHFFSIIGRLEYRLWKPRSRGFRGRWQMGGPRGEQGRTPRGRVCRRRVQWPNSDVPPATARAGTSRRDFPATIRFRWMATSKRERAVELENLRLSSLNGRKMFEEPPLISDASAFGSSLKTWVVTALCGRRRVDFCGNPAVTYVGPVLARKLLCISKLRREWSPVVVVLRSLNDCIT